jgi:hypothetical protein
MGGKNSTLSDIIKFYMWVDIDSRHWKISTCRHFQNGRYNTAKIQHCLISSEFDMWVDNDVPNWFPTLKNFYRSPFSKWPPQYRTNSTLSDFNAISYVGRLWCPKLILTSKNFYRSPFIKWPPQYRTNSTLSDFSVLNWFPTSKNFYRSPFSNGHHNTAKVQHCSISKVAFDLFFKPVVSGQFGRLHNR